jgi:predicted RNA-binding Zn-ribbon protein involved in translation (DUF1610 family)
VTQLDDGGVPRKILPALPDSDPLMGEIRWDRWEKAMILTHAPSDCDTCGFAGPLRTAMGKTLYAPEPSYVRIARSTETKDGRSKWQKREPKPYWCYTHWAQLCPACDEMTAWRRVGPDGAEDWTEIAHRPHTVAKKSPPGQGMLF